MGWGGGLGQSNSKRPLAIYFVLLLGLVSLLSDMAIDGARSIMGPYLHLLGASAIIISIIAGLSELIGYSLRIVFGWVVDRTGNYWAPMFIGYAINLVAVPALALSGDWVAAACLIMLERVGRAIRCPARDAMLSHAGTSVGRGWAYGMQEALSSVGGMLGPAVVVLVMVLGGDYRVGLEVLLIPALIAMVLLVHARRINPRPREMEPRSQTEHRRGMPRLFWLFLIAGALMAAGYADFPVMSYHVGTHAGITNGLIPVMFALVMASDALAALVFGRLYDRIGMLPLVSIAAAVPLYVPLAFSSDLTYIVLGMILYGVGLGAQDSIMRAVIADMTTVHKRASAFGIYYAAFGISWFAGSLLMGLLYEMSLLAMMAFSVALQLAAVPIMYVVMRERSSKMDTEEDGTPSQVQAAKN